MGKIQNSEIKKTIAAIWHFVKLAHKIHPRYIPLAVLSAILGAVLPFLNMILSGCLLNELADTKRMERLVCYVGILIVGNAFWKIVNGILDRKLQIAGEKLADGFEAHVGRHIMHMDFEQLEDAKILDMKEKALFNLRLHDALLGGPKTILCVLQLLITLIGVIGMLAAFNIFLVLIMFLLIAFHVFIYNRIQLTKFRFYKDIAVYNRQFAYFQDLTQDFKNAKDVRLYNMSTYIVERIHRHYGAVSRIFNQMFLKQRRHDGLLAVDIQAQTLAAYTFATWGVLRGRLMVGDFAMYISAANRFCIAATQLLAKFVDLQMLGKVLQDYLAFEGIKNKNTNGTQKMKATNSITITFQNVWFKYPNSETYVLKNISFTIRSGEKIALVGKNGAGKSTFIKLLCRLYRPDKGCILLNGTDIREFEETEYHKLLSVVFQDYKIFSFSITENISFWQNVDRDRMRFCLAQVGLLEKAEGLPFGLDTSLDKSFDKNGVELSGGELQKLAIARALYRNTPLVVLDEPTAALDPYSEYEVYAQFHRLAENRTTIYISHRLSSCRFCDRVVVFDKGELVASGKHEELVAMGGLYTQMWEAQAQYYQSFKFPDSQAPLSAIAQRL